MSELKGGYGSRVNVLKSKQLRNLIKLIYPPPPFINIIPTKEKDYIKARIFGKNKSNSILDVGSGLSKGPGSWLWKDQPIKFVTRVDIVEGPNVDLVADATDLPLPNNEFDAVVLQSVVEHVQDTEALISECVRVLKPGGLIYIEMPFLQGMHGDPNDFWRMTAEGLSKIVDQYGADQVRSGVSAGVFGTLVWIICDLISNLTNQKTVNLLIRFIFRWMFAPLRYLDFLLLKTQAIKRLAAENYFLGIKR